MSTIIRTSRPIHVSGWYARDIPQHKCSEFEPSEFIASFTEDEYLYHPTDTTWFDLYCVISNTHTASRPPQSFYLKYGDQDGNYYSACLDFALLSTAPGSGNTLNADDYADPHYRLIRGYVYHHLLCDPLLQPSRYWEVCSKCHIYNPYQRNGLSFCCDD